MRLRTKLVIAHAELSFLVIILATSVIAFPSILAAMSTYTPPRIAPNDATEILWLARIMYSETDIAHEMELVGWVARNRLETGYGSTYKEVATAPYQFSGLDRGDPHYARNIAMDYGNPSPAWHTAVAMATKVFYAPDSARPISRWVRHFYSPRPETPAPAWAHTQHLALETFGQRNTIRFKFYSDVP